MRFILILLFLTGCTQAVPVKPKWPDIPEELTIPCDELKEIPSSKLSDLLLIVTKNYSLYHECQLKDSAWIEWYKSQKEIYNSVN